MNDRYLSVVRTPVGKILARGLGLPVPPRLDRWVPGSRVVDGAVVLGSAPAGRLAAAVERQLEALAVMTVAPTGLGADEQAAALVFDASGIDAVESLSALRDFFNPLLRRLGRCGRVLVLGTPPDAGAEPAAAVAQRGLEGFTRSLAKEVRAGATVQLVLVSPGAEDRLASTLAFLLSPRSAFVSGQVVRVGTGGMTGLAAPYDVEQPLGGRVALVTGAAQGIGAAISRVLHRDGATVVGLDVAARASALRALTDEFDGDALALDVTAPDAPQRIARHLIDHHGGVDVVVHNAGVTRDKRLVNMSSHGWDHVLDVNLAAPLRITEHLLDQRVVHAGGAVVGIASVAGIAGNDGQTNYATSKAGIIGLVAALAPGAADQAVSVNAVAPGFIETQMTAAIPLVIREAGRRMSSLAQGGLPVDVAEAVAWYAAPGSNAVTGTVLRVCGQSLLGA
ncbi:MAG: 3-oxoacyl-ACP reductase [Nocardioidaceae bacterium]|nr:3-oxoacyl-ACP reductase [Nocardioidaceae bacterium]